MFGYVTFNVKYYILSQIFYKKIGWLFDKLSVHYLGELKLFWINPNIGQIKLSKFANDDK